MVFDQCSSSAGYAEFRRAWECIFREIELFSQYFQEFTMPFQSHRLLPV